MEVFFVTMLTLLADGWISSSIMRASDQQGTGASVAASTEDPVLALNVLDQVKAGVLPERPLGVEIHRSSVQQRDVIKDSPGQAAPAARVPLREA